MNTRRVTSMVGAALVATSLAGCGATETPTAPGTSSSSSTSTGSSTTAPGATSGSSSNAGPAGVKVGSTSLGDVVVDTKGMTLYLFTKDTKGSGKSSCAGQCLVTWPPLLTQGAATAAGVTGTLATIDTADGKKQVTLDGWPLYYYAKDKAAGDVTGQGVGGVWYVLDKNGTPMKAASSATTTGY